MSGELILPPLASVAIPAGVDVTDRAARALGLVGPAAGSVWDVSDRAGRALGIVASITAAVDVGDRAGRLVGIVTAADLTTALDRLERMAGRIPVSGGLVAQVGLLQPAANTGGTLTLAAAGAGLFHYLTSVRIGRTATAALAGTALLSITTTNLGGVAWRVGNLMAAGGTQRDVELAADPPFRSAVANTASTIVLPAPGAAVTWDLLVTYFTGT